MMGLTLISIGTQYWISIVCNRRPNMGSRLSLYYWKIYGKSSWPIQTYPITIQQYKSVFDCFKSMQNHRWAMFGFIVEI